MKRFLTFAAAAVAGSALLHGSPSSVAATFTSGATLDAGAPVFTVDPDGNRLASPAARNVAADRNLRQAFIYNGAENLLVDDIRVSLNIPDQQTGGLEMRIYLVANTNAPSFSPVGGPLRDIVVVDAATPIPSGGDYAQIQLDPAERFVLTSGVSYAIELSNNDDATNLGGWRHSNAAGMDFYPDGLYYDENGNVPSSGQRDLGLSINGTPTQIPEPASLLLIGSCCSLMALRRRR